MLEIRYKENFGVNGIYGIVCFGNGKIYIGSSTNLYNRINEHINTLKNRTHHNVYLQNAWNKYGIENFEIYIIEYCKKKDLFEREQFYVELYKTHYSLYGYNLAKINKSRLGYSFTEEQRKKVSDGVKRKLEDEEYRKARQAKIAAFWRSEEGRKLQSKNTTETWQNPEIKRKRLEGLYTSGVYERRHLTHNTEEFKQKVSEKSKVQWSVPVNRQKQSEIKKQYFINNPEVRQKISEKTKEQMQQAGMRQKISDAMKKFNQDNSERVEEIKQKRYKTFASQAYRDKASKIGKDLWQTDEHRNKMCTERKVRFAKQENKDRMSKQSREIWDNPETYKNTLIKRSKLSLEQLAKIKILIDAGYSESHIVSVTGYGKSIINLIYNKRSKLFNLLYNKYLVK